MRESFKLALAAAVTGREGGKDEITRTRSHKAQSIILEARRRLRGRRLLVGWMVTDCLAACLPACLDLVGSSFVRPPLLQLPHITLSAKPPPLKAAALKRQGGGRSALRGGNLGGAL